MHTARQKKLDKNTVLTILLLCIASILLILSFCGRFFAEGVLRSICNFFVGSFGISFYGIMISIIAGCSLFLSGKRITIPTRYIVNWISLYVVIVLMVHMYSAIWLLRDSSINFTQYVAHCYNYYLLPTFGGVVFGSVVYALNATLTIWGASFVLLALLAVTVFVAVNFFYDLFSHKLILDRQIADNVRFEQNDSAQPSTRTQEASLEDRARQEAMSILFHSSNPSEQQIDTASRYSEAPRSTLEQILESPITHTEPESSVRMPITTPIIETRHEGVASVNFNTFFGHDEILDEEEGDFVVDSNTVEDQRITVSNISDNDNNITVDRAPSNATANFSLSHDNNNIDIVDIVAEDIESVVESLPEQTTDNNRYIRENNVTDIVTYNGNIGNDVVDSNERSNTFGSQSPYAITPIEKPVAGGVQIGFDVVDRVELENNKNKVHKYAPYVRPPESLLDDLVISHDEDAELRKQSAEAIVKKLSVFGIKTESLEPIVGPSVTQYRLRVLSDKTRMSDFRNYADDLKSCLASKEDIRIEAPIPGTGLVGIEVANRQRRSVMLRSILESDAFARYKGKLVFAIGQDISGRFIVADLAEMPHLLIAGSTGSGKSVALNNLIVSMMYKYTPEYLRFLMVDPKFVELSKYNDTPHLLTSEAITTVGDALAGLEYLIAEMGNRFMLFKNNAVSNISEYNQKVNPLYTQKLPYIVLVVDELADLMASSKKSVEAKIIRLAQKSRACGIHIVLATQRPSVDIVTGVIKANLPARMALTVASFADSKTILDGGGAEKLLGKGDMLFANSGSPNAIRLQGAFVSNDEIYKLVDYIKEQNETYFPEEIANSIFASRREDIEEATSANDTNAPEEKQLDPLCKKALLMWLTKNNGKASIASLQRSMGVGFNRAGKIFESLVELGYVEAIAPNETGSKPRMVLVTLEELDKLLTDQNIN